MLFKQRFLNLIANGEIDTAYRKWTRPTIRESGTLLTPVGVLHIKSLEVIDYDQITDKDITGAGYHSRDELDREFALNNDGQIYKIKFEVKGADPRIALREKTDITADEMADILKKLNGFDTRGKVKDLDFLILIETFEPILDGSSSAVQPVLAAVRIPRCFGPASISIRDRPICPISARAYAGWS